MSFLQAEELARIWQQLEDTACVEVWSLHLHRWFSLVKAVSARDAPSMVEYSTELLESESDASDTGRLEYLVATSMLGHLSVGDRRGAREAWSKFGSPAMAAGELTAVLRLLVAYSQS